MHKLMNRQGPVPGKQENDGTATGRQVDAAETFGKVINKPVKLRYNLNNSFCGRRL